MSDFGGLPAREREILDLLGAHRVAGIVLQSPTSARRMRRHVRELKMPVVTIDQRIEGVERDFVGTTTGWRAPCWRAHLLQFGHRRIGFIAGTAGLFTSGERTAGFVETLGSAGVEVDPSLIVDGRYEGEEAILRRCAC